MATPDTPPTRAATPTEGALDLEPIKARVSKASPGLWEKRPGDVQDSPPDRTGATLDELTSALKEIERHCPCGARPESPTTHPHVCGCPVGRALYLTGSLRSAAPQDDSPGAALDMLEQEITRWDDQGGDPSPEWFHGNCGEAMQWCAKRVRELLPHLRAAHGGRKEAVPVVKDLLPTLFTAHPDGIFREISIDRVREWFTAPVLHADLSAASAAPQKDTLTCGGCGGPHPFDTSVPSVRWNAVIRAQGLSEYLCLTCIVKVFAQCSESFTATLWGGEFNGLPIEVIINGKNATDAAAISDENTALRAQLRWGRSAAGAETP